MLLTLPPLKKVALFSFDLHASSTLPAFNLNQDQILEENIDLENLVVYIKN